MVGVGADGRGGLPDLPRRPWRPGVTVAAFATAVALGSGTLLGTLPLAAAAGVAMLLMAGGWVLLLGLPSPRGTTSVLYGASVLVLAGGLASGEVALLLPWCLALAMIVEFLHQLARRDGRPRLVESVSGSVMGISMITSGACLLLLGPPAGADAAACVLAAVAAACLADVGLRWGAGGPVAGAVAVALAVAASVAAAQVVDLAMPVWLAAVGGGLAGGSAYALRQVQSVLPTLFGMRAQLASGIGSVLSTGVVAYGLAWLAARPEMMDVLAR